MGCWRGALRALPPATPFPRGRHAWPRLPSTTQSIIPTPLRASGLTSHAGGRSERHSIDFVVTTLSPEGRRERTAEVYPTLAGVAGFTPKPFYCSNAATILLLRVEVKRWNDNPSLSGQYTVTARSLHG